MDLLLLTLLPPPLNLADRFALLLQGWAVVGSIFSLIWQYEKDGTVATLSLDYPFFDYHDVTVCYRNSGWTIDGSKLEMASNENGHIPCKEVDMLKVEGLGAALLYSTVDESGVWLEETGSRWPFDEEGNLGSRFFHRLSLMPFANVAGESRINYRIQILAAARGGLGKDQRKEVKSLFQKARLLLADQFVAPAADPTPSPEPSVPKEHAP